MVLIHRKVARAKVAGPRVGFNLLVGVSEKNRGRERSHNSQGGQKPVEGPLEAQVGAV